MGTTAVGLRHEAVAVGGRKVPFEVVFFRSTDGSFPPGRDLAGDIGGRPLSAEGDRSGGLDPVLRKTHM